MGSPENLVERFPASQVRAHRHPDADIMQVMLAAEASVPDRLYQAFGQNWPAL